jgi:hypothetical protein
MTGKKKLDVSKKGRMKKIRGRDEHFCLTK